VAQLLDEGELTQLIQDYQAAVDFAFVYIAEAHASDEWPIGAPRCLRQSRTTDERIERAIELTPYLLQHTVLVEPVTLLCEEGVESFSDLYSPWPAKAYIFSGARLVSVAPIQGGTLARGLQDSVHNEGGHANTKQ
jgi:hypothetical protein